MCISLGNKALSFKEMDLLKQAIKVILNLARIILLTSVSVIVAIMILGLIYDPDTKGLSLVDYFDPGKILLICTSLLVIFYIMYKFSIKKLHKNQTQ